jgi:hypothetical protein
MISNFNNNLIKSKHLYCVYLTIYRGNKLPPFYIGSTSIQNIEQDGYHGSVRSKSYRDIWKSELQINSHLFITKIIATRFTRKEAVDLEKNLQLKMDAANSPMYINKAIASHQFMLHVKHSDETKKKISQSLKGRIASINQLKNLKRTPLRSINQRKKISDSLIGRAKTIAHSNKIAQALLGKKKSITHRDNMKKAWETRNKIMNVDQRKKISDTLCGHSHSLETKAAISASKRGVATKKIVCPHCNKIGGISVMKRYHLDNCKNYQIYANAPL